MCHLRQIGLFPLLLLLAIYFPLLVICQEALISSTLPIPQENGDQQVHSANGTTLPSNQKPELILTTPTNVKIEKANEEQELRSGKNKTRTDGPAEVKETPVDNSGEPDYQPEVEAESKPNMTTILPLATSTKNEIQSTTVKGEDSEVIDTGIQEKGNNSQNTTTTSEAPQQPVDSTTTLGLGPSPAQTTTLTTKVTTLTTKHPPKKTEPSLTKETTIKFVTLTDKNIEVDVGASTDSPPYIHVTPDKGSTDTVPHNDSFVVAPGTGAVNGENFFTPKMIGILVAAAVGLILIVCIVAVTIVILKRRRYKKKHDFPIIENPRYIGSDSGKGQAHNYRFSGDASLLIGGPTLNQSALGNNNINDKNDMNSDRKKRRAPPPPNPFTGQHDTFPLRQDSNDYYEKLSNKKKNKAPPPPNPFTGEIDCLSNPNAIQYFEQLLKNKKRRAPPPPNPFTGVIDEPSSQTIYYEKDSPHGSEIELSTFTAGFKKDRLSNENEAPEADRLTPQASHSGPEAEEDEVPEPESQALLSDIERETGFRLTGGPPKERRSVADKYQFSDDEEARESRDYYRQESFDNFSSDDDLDNSKDPAYEVSDIHEELQTSDECDKSKIPIES